MHIAHRAIVLACLIFAGTVLGHVLQWLLPPQHLADAKSAIGMVQGLVTLLLALVLGLLIWTSYGVYAQQQSEAMTLGTQILELDLLFDRLGPDGRRGHALMRQELIATRKRFWGDRAGSAPPQSYTEARAELSRMDAFFAGLKPATDDARAALDEARRLSISIVQTHLLMGRQLRNPVPKALISSVILWAILLFWCFGLGATVNALAVIAEFLGAVSVASAIFLILEFSQPYVGLFRISPEAIDQVIAAHAPPGEA
jgi:hypothetical protein